MRTTLLLDHEPVADGGWVIRALLRLEGAPPEDRDRTPLNLSLVLDRSGSMAGEKIEAAREAARLLVRRLWPEDRVSVVAFGSRVETIAPPATGREQQALSERIDAIGIEGCTNLSGGWLQGRDHVARHFRRGGVNRVLLLTDGIANEGITEPDRLCGLCATAASQGVGTTTVGFGTGYNEGLLRAMADAGGGGTYYIERPDQAPGVFEEELEGLLSLAAQNLSVRLEPGAGAEFVAVHHSYPSREEEGALVLEVGDLYAREPRLVLAEFLVPPGPEEGDEVEVARLVVSAHVLTEGGGVELRTVTLPITMSPEKGGRVEPEVRRELLLLEAAKARRAALEERERGDYGAASRHLREAADRLSAAGLSDGELREEAADLAGMADHVAADGVSEADAKYLYQRAYDSTRSRRSASRRIRRTRPDED